MKISDAFPSNWLKAADLQGRTIKARINLVRSEEIGSEHKPVVYFEGKDKGLVLNKTNAATIVLAYGDDTEAWGGADIELFPQAVPFNGQMVPSIRVRIPAAETNSAPSRPAASFAPNARTRAGHDERNPPPMDDDIPF